MSVGFTLISVDKDQDSVTLIYIHICSIVFHVT